MREPGVAKTGVRRRFSFGAVSWSWGEVTVWGVIVCGTSDPVEKVRKNREPSA